jgi:FkbM family methyltransferase
MSTLRNYLGSILRRLKHKLSQLIAPKNNDLTTISAQLRHLNEQMLRVNDALYELNEMTRIVAGSIRYNSLPADKVARFEFQGKQISYFVPRGWYDFIQQHPLLFEDFCESDILQDLANNYLDEKSFVVDIGSNVGNHIIFYSTVIGVRKVVGFEPQQFEYNTLMRNLELNGITNTEIHNLALSNKDSLGVFEHSSKASKLRGNRGAVGFSESQRGSIVMRTLDSFALQDVTFIKVDVEGNAYDVLLGARNTIQDCRPILFVELFPSEHQKCFELLEGVYGYRMEKNYGHNNYLFIPTTD